jgi:hypothetical protein
MSLKLLFISVLCFLSLAKGELYPETQMLLQTGQYDFNEVDVDVSKYTNKEAELSDNEEDREASFAGSFVQSMLKSGMKMPHTASSGTTTMSLGWK